MPAANRHKFALCVVIVTMFPAFVKSVIAFPRTLCAVDSLQSKQTQSKSSLVSFFGFLGLFANSLVPPKKKKTKKKRGEARIVIVAVGSATQQHSALQPTFLCSTSVTSLHPSFGELDVVTRHPFLKGRRLAIPIHFASSLRLFRFFFCFFFWFLIAHSSIQTNLHRFPSHKQNKSKHKPRTNQSTALNHRPSEAAEQPPPPQHLSLFFLRGRRNVSFKRGHEK